MQQVVSDQAPVSIEPAGLPVRKPRSQQGFTLVELVVVLSILAVIIAVMSSGLFQSKEDAKVQAVKTQLLKDFPNGITQLVTMGNTCDNTTVTYARMVTRGVPALTVFGSVWSITTSGGNTATVTYPLDLSDTTLATDLQTAMSTAPNVASVSGSATQIVINYRCN
ncbi:type II secretion system protein [Pseudomonas sp. MWU12-2323]|uniref:type II secretion system protein n=1 Tax=Pseudomonas sp. MWU12-2323 TaxID=2651296 RepID=UPI00128DFA30|nr:type II secretion system protein [Pseudomonas sp. MWU12-2323]MPQ69297.1 prepilin-type N-terminal cleavage/methylation domain-containing protein [Pseudomonas sp. MWU12-2323]